MFKVPERYRVKEGPLGSDSEIDNSGAFEIPIKDENYLAIAAQDLGWEHVSISRIVAWGRKNRPPRWEIMCEIKNIFWSRDTCVLQYHPAEKDYINCHPYTLHLWRPIDQKFPTPPKIMV